MAHILEDRVLESSTSTGTGAFTLGGAVTGFRPFSDVCAVGDTVPYFIEALDSVGQPTGDYEYGVGTYSAADELTRTTVSGSSNAGAAVDFPAGTKNVAITLTKTELATQISDALNPVNTNVTKATLTSGTKQDTTSGTSKDFTGIPSWAKRVVLSFANLSTNGNSLPIAQIGDSGGIETSGYVSYASAALPTTLTTSSTSSFCLDANWSAAANMHGKIELTLVDAATNTWVAAVVGGGNAGGAHGFVGGGSKSLSGTLTQIRLTTTNGTDLLDAGMAVDLYD